MTNAELLRELRDHLRGTWGNVGGVMETCGVSESTVRRWIERGKPPKNPIIREALVKYLSKNGAKK